MDGEDLVLGQHLATLYLTEEEQEILVSIIDAEYEAEMAKGRPITDSEATDIEVGTFDGERVIFKLASITPYAVRKVINSKSFQL